MNKKACKERTDELSNQCRLLDVHKMHLLKRSLLLAEDINSNFADKIKVNEEIKVTQQRIDEIAEEINALHVKYFSQPLPPAGNQ